MQSIAFTLVADGSSDRALLPFIVALMDSYCPVPFISQFADELHLSDLTLAARMRAALQLYPCDLLFVHRDAEGQDGLERVAEIRRGIEGVTPEPALVCVVPVRMTEAWLLTDEAAIRAAVGNPRGTAPLSLPGLSRLESVDAKKVLFDALEAATDLGARRRRKFKPEHYRHKVADLLQDLTAVRKLASFQHLESQVSDFFAKLA